MSIDVDYENPWIYNGVPFDGSLIGDNHGFVYNITNLTNQRQYIGESIFGRSEHQKERSEK